MKNRKNMTSIDFNAPVILGLTFLSLVILILSLLTGGSVGRFFAVYYSSWFDPFLYLRLFTHVITHASISHFTGNFMMILAVGPLVEEKYGSGRLFVMVCATALITGLINVIAFRGVMLLGASGIVFMLILLASFVNIQEGRLPLTVLLVGIFYIGNEIASGLFSRDNISHLAHIIGGLCGGGFGFLLHRK